LGEGGDHFGKNPGKKKKVAGVKKRGVTSRGAKGGGTQRMYVGGREGEGATLKIRTKEE